MAQQMVLDVSCADSLGIQGGNLFIDAGDVRLIVPSLVILHSRAKYNEGDVNDDGN